VCVYQLQRLQLVVMKVSDSVLKNWLSQTPGCWVAVVE
jgi:hypothetical protein